MDIMRVAAWVFIITVVLALLVLAQNFLIPLVVAACIWFIINSLSNLFARIQIGSFRLPMWTSRMLALFVIVGAIFGSVEIIIGSVNGMMEAAPLYQRNLEHMFGEAMTALGVEETPTFDQLLDQIDLSALAAQMGTAASSLAGSLFLVIFYVLFMLMEQGTFPKKWRATFPSKESRRMVGLTLQHINASVRNYITYKTGINLVTALLNFVILWLVGMDFPVFWAFFMFLINWIPTIGTFLSVGLPSLFALVQFNAWPPVIVVLVGIVAVQTVMINIVEPRVLGRLLNISGLVVMLSLVLWGMIWGIVGMVLSVPIMVSLIIILANFPSTKTIAIWLSADGKAEPVE
jgi:AI-2 transport protein TqsA